MGSQNRVHFRWWNRNRVPQTRINQWVWQNDLKQQLHFIHVEFEKRSGSLFECNTDDDTIIIYKQVQSFKTFHVFFVYLYSFSYILYSFCKPNQQILCMNKGKFNDIILSRRYRNYYARKRIKSQSSVRLAGYIPVTFDYYKQVSQ